MDASHATKALKFVTKSAKKITELSQLNLPAMQHCRSWRYSDAAFALNRVMEMTTSLKSN